MATIRRRKGATGVVRWQWRVTVKGRPTEYGTCPTKACALHCSEEAEKSIRQGRTSQRMTLAELIDLYVAGYLPTIPDSAPHFRMHLDFWRDELGELLASGVTAPAIAAARARLKAKPGRTARPRSNSTVNRYVTTLSSVFSWAVQPEQGFVDRNPARDVRKLPEPKGRVRFLSRPVDEPNSELERLLEACRASNSPMLLDVVSILLGTGCRESEVMSLRRSEVRLGEGGFTIPAERAKTEEPRFVPLEGLALEAVRRRLQVPTFGSPFLFPGKTRGEHARFPRRAWRTALKRAGIENFRGHDLRHTHLSYLGMMGKSQREIMEAGGHKSIQSSVRYTHLSDRSKSDVARAVNAKLLEWTGHAEDPS